MEALSLEASFRSVLASALAQLEQKLGSAHEDAVAELTTELAALKGRPVQGIDAREGEAEAESSEAESSGRAIRFSHGPAALRALLPSGEEGRPRGRPGTDFAPGEMLRAAASEWRVAAQPCLRLDAPLRGSARRPV